MRALYWVPPCTLPTNHTKVTELFLYVLLETIGSTHKVKHYNYKILYVVQTIDPFPIASTSYNEVFYIALHIWYVMCV